MFFVVKWWMSWCRCLHVTRVAEVDARLVGTFVWAVLQRDDVLASLQLLVAEIPNVLLGLFRSDWWLVKVVSLKLKFWDQSTVQWFSPFQLTLRPNDCKQITTEFKFWRSHKSTDWNVSWFGTPKALACSKNAEMFSMHLKAIVLSFTFLIVPAFSELMSLQRRTPFFKTSKKLSMSPLVLIGSPVTSLIHSRHSAANSSLYFELIWGRQRKIVE